MHKLPSQHVLARFRIGALLFIVFWLLVAAGGVMALHGLAYHEKTLQRNLQAQRIVTLDDEWELWSGLGMLALSPVVSLAQRVAAARANCPLCITPPLVRKNCQRSRGIRIFWGSYRLPVAMSVLIRGRFTCPYCGETTRCEVRQRNQRQPSHFTHAP